MRPISLQPIGPSSKPSPPPLGVIYNGVFADPMGDNRPVSIAPVGNITLSAESDNYVLGRADSPAMIVPGSRVALEELLSSTRTDTGSYADMWRTMSDLIGWKIAAPESRDYMTVDADVIDDNVAQVSNAKRTEWIMKHHTYQMLLRRMQTMVSTCIRPGLVNIEPIGLGVLDRAGQLRVRPGWGVKFGGHTAELTIPLVPMKHGHMKTTFQYHGWVSYCLKQLIKSRKANIWLEDELDLHAYASYLIAVYGGTGKSPPDFQLFSVSDIVDDNTLLAMPYSEAYPRLRADRGDAEEFKAELLFKMSLILATRRTSGLICPVEYKWESGTVAVVREALPDYIVAPLEMGGSNTWWMHPATISDTLDGIYVPCAIHGSRSVWERRSKLPDTFHDQVIDRGEINHPGETIKENLLLKPTRDGRVSVVRHRLDRYLIISAPTGFNGVDANEETAAFVLSFVSDPVANPSKGCYVTPASFGAKFDLTRGLGEDGRAGTGPLPGGINPAVPPPLKVAPTINEIKATAKAIDAVGVLTDEGERKPTPAQKTPDHPTADTVKRSK